MDGQATPIKAFSIGSRFKASRPPQSPKRRTDHCGDSTACGLPVLRRVNKPTPGSSRSRAFKPMLDVTHIAPPHPEQIRRPQDGRTFFLHRVQHDRKKFVLRLKAPMLKKRSALIAQFRVIWKPMAILAQKPLNHPLASATRIIENRISVFKKATGLFLRFAHPS